MRRNGGEVSGVEIPGHYRSPESLFNELGIEDPEDIRVEAIAQYCGATIVYEPLQGSDARLIGYGDRAFITVNNQSTQYRQRFSAAHELGHWMWDRGKMAFACGGLFPKDGDPAKEGGDAIERRANRYAVDLLLPEKLFFRKMDDCRRDICFGTIQCLSKEFQTSLSATAIRYTELSSNPAVLIASMRGKRRWYVRSPHVPRRLKLKEKPDHTTLTGRLLAGEKVSLEPAQLSATRWIENEEAMDSSIQEDCLKVSPDLVLTLLSWRYES